MELWKNQQKDGDKYKSMQKKGELHQEIEPLKERKSEKINKTQIPNEGTSKTRLKSTKGCIIELYFIILKVWVLTLLLDASNLSLIFVSTISNQLFNLAVI